MSAPAVQQGPLESCTVDADCGYGEIDRELSSSAQCTCLHGCGYVPLNRETIERRLEQHAALCDPLKDADGRECGADDCSPQPALTCFAGKCGNFLDWGPD